MTRRIAAGVGLALTVAGFLCAEKASAQDPWTDYGSAMLSWELTRSEQATEKEKMSALGRTPVSEKAPPTPTATEPAPAPAKPAATKRKRVKTKKKRTNTKKLDSQVKGLLEGIE